MDTRIESLLKSLERNHHRFKETFIDEDTGEEVTVNRDEVVEFDTTEEERELMESIIADVAHLSDEDLETFRARFYYDLALKLGYELDEDGSDAWDDSDDPGEEFPEEFCYTLTGNAQTLDGVETLIRDLCKRFGIPENEEDGLGLFVPLRMLMKVLVGSDTEYYRGNIQYLERETPDRLVITTEADSGEPLLYALRQCFENLKVEMKE